MRLQSKKYWVLCAAICRHPIAFLHERPQFIGALAFFLSTSFVNLGNYLFNLILGRLLGPALFADVSLIVTIMLVTTFITLALTTTVAWFAAVYVADAQWGPLASLRAWCLRNAYGMGFIAALLLIVGSVPLAHVFHMHSPWPFIILGLGFPVFFVMAIERGILQGRAQFGWLAVSTQGEMWTRLLGAVAAVLLGLSLPGIVGVISLSFIAGWLLARHARKGLPAIFERFPRTEQLRVQNYLGPVIIGLLGQIIINNSDILIVKGSFPSHTAGLYAALALIGRIVYFATWSIVVVMFPLIAQKYQRGEAHRPWLWLMCGIITGISGAIVLVTLFMPTLVVQILFGPAYLPIAPLLWLYALATAFYTLANGVTSYYLSLGNGTGNYIVLGAGCAQVLGLLLFHRSLYDVVLVQVVLMAALLLVLLLWDLYAKYRYVPAPAYE